MTHTITIINTSDLRSGLMHDAARPFAVVQGNQHSALSRTIGRYATLQAAQRKARVTDRKVAL